jgi:hypothetical protein
MLTSKDAIYGQKWVGLVALSTNACELTVPVNELE